MYTNNSIDREYVYLNESEEEILVITSIVSTHCANLVVSERGVGGIHDYNKFHFRICHITITDSYKEI